MNVDLVVYIVVVIVVDIVVVIVVDIVIDIVVDIVVVIIIGAVAGTKFEMNHNSEKSKESLEEKFNVRTLGLYVVSGIIIQKKTKGSF